MVQDDSPPRDENRPAEPQRRGVVVPLKAEVYAVVPKVGVLHSFRAAFVGVARTVASQRNMKLHVLSALMVVIVGMTLPFDLSVRVSLLFAIAAVWFAEILNTGLEALVDLFVRDYHRLAMLAKDAAAAGVLVLSLSAVLIFADIVWSRWELVLTNQDAVLRSILFGFPLVVSEAVGLFLVRRGLIAVMRLLSSVVLLSAIAWTSTDPVYTGFGYIIVGLAAYSRWNFPQLTGRGAPRGADAE